MSQGDIETYHDDGQWKNRREGRSRPSSRADTKQEAQALGRQAAIRDGVEHVIKKKDGTIGARNTYPRAGTHGEPQAESPETSACATP